MPARKAGRASWIRIGIYVAIALLIWEFLFIPIPSGPQALAKAQSIQLVSNGRRLWTAAHLDEPTRAVYPATMAATNASEYIAALIRSGSLKEADLRILATPHHWPPAKLVGELSEKNISFTIYRIGPDDPPETVFLASKPDVFKDLRVEIHKDGSGQVYKLAQFPTITSPLPKAAPQTLLP